MSKAILFDSNLCVGCKACEMACAEHNKLPYDDVVAAEDKTSDHKFTSVISVGDEIYMRRMCMHCTDPTCVSVCPVGAFTKTADGPVIYDEDKCMGCRYCMLACPFGVPKYEWEKILPRVRKCHMCSDRVPKGLPTACAEACPTGATLFGERDELIAEARNRIQEYSDQYKDHIFGLTEVGGTSVLLLAGVPFERFGLRSHFIDEPLPMLTYRVLSRLPDLVLLGGVLLGGIYWITNRRDEVAATEGDLRPSDDRRKE